MDGVEHCSANMISPSPLEADPHEAGHVEVRLSSIPHAGQGLSQKKSLKRKGHIALWGFLLVKMGVFLSIGTTLRTLLAKIGQYR